MQGAGLDFRGRLTSLNVDDECPGVLNGSTIVYPGGGNLIKEYADNPYSLERSIRANLGRGNVMVRWYHEVKQLVFDPHELERRAGFKWLKGLN